MKAAILFKFEKIEGSGSCEHFFHFMWGYLLPATFEILAREDKKPQRSRYYFDSCGPVMDIVLCDFLNMLDVEFHILKKEQIFYLKFCATTVLIDRWDVIIHLINISEKDLKNALLDKNGSHAEKYFFRKYHTASLKSTLYSSIYQVRKRILELLTKNQPVFTGPLQLFLIIRRSKEPNFYKANGGAEIPQYGISRRSLAGLEHAFAELKRCNLPVEIYEPGQSPIIQQITKFSGCKGIIGIRGAEFANIIWMQEGTKVVMINPTSMGEPFLQKNLAEILNVELIKINTDQGNYPDLLSFDIKKYFLEK